MIQNHEDPLEEYQCIFYNSPFRWIDILNINNLKVLTIIGQNLASLEGVERLRNLTEFWMVECSLKNISCSEELKELDLANNYITEIGTTLMNCDKLEYLNLAGNPIKDIFSTQQLRCLPSLKVLQLYDPLYRITPIIKFVNYRLFVIENVPRLQSLDGFRIYREEAANVSSYFASKDIYYSVQHHNVVHIYFSEMIDRSYEHYQKLKRILERIFKAQLLKKEEKNKNKLMRTETDKELERLADDIKAWETNNENWYEKVENEMQIRSELLHLEHHYFGNVKFVDISSDDIIMTLLHNILQEFICPGIKSYLLDSLQLDRAIQVIDRRNLIEGLNIFKAMTTDSCPNSINFFILNEPVGVVDSANWNVNYLAAHFNSKKYNSRMYSITNSLAIADFSLLNKIHGLPKNISSEMNSQRILILVYTKQTLQFSNVYNHAKPLKDKITCDCRIYKTEEHTIIVPVFIIEYHYIFKMRPKSQKRPKIHECLRDPFSSEYIHVEKSTPAEFSCVSLSSTFNVQSWQNLTYLCLSKSLISSFGALPPMITVTHLDVSYNKIANLYEISKIFPNLIVLIASFNDVKVVKPLMEMKFLQELDLSSNRMCHFNNTLTWLKKGTKALLRLNMKYNPFMDIHSTKHLPYIAKLFFPNLECCNDADCKGEIAANIYLDSTSELKVYKLSEELIIERNLHNLHRDKCAEFDRQNKRTESTRPENHITLYEDEQQQQPICIYINKYEEIFSTLVIKMDPTELRYLTISHTYMNFLIVSVIPNNLEKIDLSFNMMYNLGQNIIQSECLVRLELKGNYLVHLGFLKHARLKSIKYLNVSKNLLYAIEGIENCSTLEEFYVSFNFISDWKVLRIIKHCSLLKVCDFRENFIKNIELINTFLTYHLTNLKYLNGEEITDNEVEHAQIFYSGILDQDYLLKSYSSEKVLSLSELTLTNSSLRQVSLPTLDNLTSVNLEHNNLTNFSSLVYLQNLKYLCLSNNQITTFGEIPDAATRCFENLEVLYLNMNNIRNLEKLELYRAPKLVALFLHDNELCSVQGLSKMDNLKHLVLDRNKLNAINPSAVADLINLKNLYVEYNHLHSLNFLKELKSLKSLFLAYNKILEYETLHNFTHVSKIKELTVYGNPMCRFNSHYIALLSCLPKLCKLDGIQFDRNHNSPIYKFEEGS
ncbi:uncharacterized protein isoform X2 [Rhodnius prolixus]|uniref:uncharacterized protein isoform X2 n=1 Tax=Rhodnius prolixus TaxID=13249 RepID=UPI003D18FAA2